MDIRAGAARYYDLQPIPFDDVPFYVGQLQSSQASVLELGCGTGRVLIPLAAHCGYIHGLDASEAMLGLCRQKMREARLVPEKARVELADITRADLGRRFDLIIAPYRVFQNLESDENVAGFFKTVRNHLAPGGASILNVFRPNRDPEGIVERSLDEQQRFSWEAALEGGRVLAFEGFRQPAYRDASRLVIYPRLSYHEYRGENLMGESVLDISMRVYYADEFERLITAHGFRVLEKWGGYNGEAYGEGPELVVKFGLSDLRSAGERG